MKVLVTGAGGFVGSYLIDELERAGHKVIAASHKPMESGRAQATEIFDLREQSSVTDVIRRHEPEGVVHLAAQASVPSSWDDPAYTMEVNVVGAVHLISALPNECRVVLVGSAQQYGRVSSALPIKEEEPLNPNTPYAISKTSQEMIGRLYAQEFGRKIVATRSFNHTGPGQSREYVVAGFCSLLAEIDAGTRPPLMEVGWLAAVRDFLDVRDVVRAYRLLLEAGTVGKAYNVASGHGVSIGEILTTLIRLSELSVEVREDATPRVGDIPSLVGDNSRIRADTGWEPEITLERSLADTLESFRRARK